MNLVEATQLITRMINFEIIQSSDPFLEALQLSQFKAAM
jgi:hypothetical protein